MAIDFNILNNVTYGMYIISAQGDSPAGCIINTCMQITSQDPVFAFSVNKENLTHDVILQSNKFALSILSENTPPSLFGTFGFRSGRDINKFEKTEYQMHHGVPVVTEGCCGALIFDVLSVTDIETHSVIFGRLSETIAVNDEIPMTYSYYHRVIKGRAPKTAPTYQDKSGAAGKKATWVCEVCGHKEQAEQLSDDYRCPVCGVGKEQFTKQ